MDKLPVYGQRRALVESWSINPLRRLCSTVTRSAAMQEFRLRLMIPAYELLAYYRDGAQYALVTSIDGKRIRMPAYLLRPHATAKGIEGEFILRCDDKNRFISLQKL